MDTYPHEFAELQKKPNEELGGDLLSVIYGFLIKNKPYIHHLYFTDLCEKLFDLLDGVAESNKRKVAIWPLQIMLLILNPVRFMFERCGNFCLQNGTLSKVFAFFTSESIRRNCNG